MKAAEPKPAQTPVRPDLASVAPMYYPIVETERFPSLDQMCQSIGASPALVREYVNRANLNQSDYVVIDRLVMQHALGRALAVVYILPKGGVILCAGLFDMLNEDRSAVAKFVSKMATPREMRGKRVEIGEFRPNPATLPN